MILYYIIYRFNNTKHQLPLFHFLIASPRILCIQLRRDMIKNETKMNFQGTTPPPAINNELELFVLL
jgi:hypothetical protein